MITIEIPGWRKLELRWLVLDVNGTIALDGWVRAEVPEALGQIPELQAVAVTADTHGRAGELREALGIDVRVVSAGDEAAQKRAIVEELGTDAVVAVGNGANDVEMLRAAAVGLCVLGPEGTSVEAMEAADIVVPGIRGALGLLANPARLAATLRR